MIDLETTLRTTIEAAAKKSYDAMDAAIQGLYDDLAKAHQTYSGAMEDRLAVVRGEKPVWGLPNVADGPKIVVGLEEDNDHDDLAFSIAAIVEDRRVETKVESAIKQAAE